MSALADWLKSPDCKIEFLRLDYTYLGDEQLAILAGGLKENSTVKRLSLRTINEGEEEMTDITQGLQYLWTVWENPSSALENVCLEDNKIQDDALIGLASVLEGKRKLKVLDLSSSCEFITIKGWAALSKHLRGPDCVLHTLKVTQVDDFAAVVIAVSLRENATLKKLGFGYMYHATSTCMDALRRALCDKSSVSNTYNSNHTLCDLDARYFDPPFELPSELTFYLDLNKNNNKTEVAMKKIAHVSASTPPIDESAWRMMDFLGLADLQTYEF